MKYSTNNTITYLIIWRAVYFFSLFLFFLLLLKWENLVLAEMAAGNGLFISHLDHVVSDLVYKFFWNVGQVKRNEYSIS